MLALILCAPAVAHAQKVQLIGWTDDGLAVTRFWANGESTGYSVCIPEAPDDASADGICTPCADAKACGVETAITAKPAKRSPDKKIKIKDKTSCKKVKGEKTCTRTVQFGKKGTLRAGSVAKTRLHVYFRPDSGAALVAFDGNAVSDWPVFYVVDLGKGPAQGADRYAIELGPVSEDGDASVQVTFMGGGKAWRKSVDSIHVGYGSDGFAAGEVIPFDADLRPQHPKVDAALGDLVKQYLPAGTVAAVGFVHAAAMKKFSFKVYAVVVDGGSRRIVRQQWHSNRYEPSDEQDVGGAD